MSHRSPRPPRPSLVGLALLGLSACSGQLSSSGDTPDEGTTTEPDGTKPGKTGPGSKTDPGNTGTPSKPGEPVTGTPPGETKPITAPATDAAKTVGAFRAQRLTREEYVNTVRDLLGDKEGLARSWPSDTSGASGFASPGQVGGVEVSNYEDVAQQLAAKVKATDLAACDKGLAEEACAGAFVEKFGLRAFRRPVEADEKADLVALYKKLRGAPTSLDHAGAMQGLLEAMLQSPRFLYRWEDGIAAKADGSGLRPINPYALASRLSYFLWRSMPDDKLFEAAKNGDLADEGKLAAQARRLLEDPRAADTVADFTRQWLLLSKLDTVAKDPNVYKAFNPELRAAMKEELLAFSKEAVLGAGKLEALLLGTKTAINEGLAKLYGVSGVTGKELVPTTLDKTQRAGVLTTAAFLTVNGQPYASSPIKRGHVIRERLLCQPLAPAAGVDTTPPPDKPNQTTREATDAITGTGAGCISCHQLMNPLGYGLENYDGIGQYRTQEKGRDIDASGTIEAVGKPRPFKNAQSLAQALLETEETQKCVALQWSRFALGREETAADASSVEFVQAHFRAGGLDLKALLTSIVRSRAFRYHGAQ